MYRSYRVHVHVHVCREWNVIYMQHVCRGNIEPPAVFISIPHGMAFEFSQAYSPLDLPSHYTYTHVHVYLFTNYPVESPTLIRLFLCMHTCILVHPMLTVYMYMY